MKPDPGKCPVCGKDEKREISSNLNLCRNCHIIFNSDCRSLSYDRDYFINEYNEQYGRTYLEDYSNIYNLSNLRLNRILELLAVEGKHSLLDIGSAAGFFLKAAKDRGISTLLGIEISEYAADYCRKTFGIDVIESPFDNVELHKRFDIITSWFFIEHCMDPLGAMTRIFSMLNRGGVFALSVPSHYGPMFYFDKEKWVATHPADHRIDLSPSSAKRILKQIGFRKVYVIKSGYHPERVLKSSSLIYGFFEPLYRKFTDLTAFSDTIEIYAVR
jgi:SAM-dependent methyltransferase